MEPVIPSSTFGEVGGDTFFGSHKVIFDFEEMFFSDDVIRSDRRPPRIEASVMSAIDHAVK